MLTATEGTYENGQIVLERKPKVSAKTKVMVILEEEEAVQSAPSGKRPFGLAKGAIHLSPDFDDPLEDLEDHM